MTYDTKAAGRSRLDSDDEGPRDRILLIVCAAVWLVALGAGVAAIVALVDLGTPRSSDSKASDTPWLLYAVIGVSAVVIAGAVPLLIRARSTALDGGQKAPAERSEGAQAAFGPPLGTEGVRSISVPGLRRQSAPPATSRVGFPTAAVEQLWLRSTVAIASAIGAATAAVAVATYLMASDHNTAAWIVFGIAGLLAVAMPVVPWFYLKQLQQLLA